MTRRRSTKALVFLALMSLALGCRSLGKGPLDPVDRGCYCAEEPTKQCLCPTNPGRSASCRCADKDDDR